MLLQIFVPITPDHQDLQVIILLLPKRYRQKCQIILAHPLNNTISFLSLTDQHKYNFFTFFLWENNTHDKSGNTLFLPFYKRGKKIPPRSLKKGRKFVVDVISSLHIMNLYDWMDLFMSMILKLRVPHWTRYSHHFVTNMYVGSRVSLR